VASIKVFDEPYTLDPQPLSRYTEGNTVKAFACSEKVSLRPKTTRESETRLGFNHLREHLRFHNLGRACVRVPLSKRKPTWV